MLWCLNTGARQSGSKILFSAIFISFFYALMLFFTPHPSIEMGKEKLTINNPRKAHTHFFLNFFLDPEKQQKKSLYISSYNIVFYLKSLTPPGIPRSSFFFHVV
jgi:hypothetical protein